MSNHRYYVYIMTNRYHTVLYTGITKDIDRRAVEHLLATNGFTSKYNVNKLVYVEQFSCVHQAIAREKQLKGYGRPKKLALIAQQNPTWRDLCTPARLPQGVPPQGRNDNWREGR